jgi:hypothetical protein
MFIVQTPRKKGQQYVCLKFSKICLEYFLTFTVTFKQFCNLCVSKIIVKSVCVCVGEREREREIVMPGPKL